MGMPHVDFAFYACDAILDRLIALSMLCTATARYGLEVSRRILYIARGP